MSLKHIGNNHIQGCHIIKETFILFYSLSNIATSFYIIPVLPFAFENTFHKEENWLYIGAVYGIYEFGKFFGNFLWVKLNQYVSSSLLVIISLSLLSVLNFAFGFVKNYNFLLIIRFILGFANNLPIISKNIYAELSIVNNLTRKLYIFTGIALLCGFLIPLASISSTYMNEHIKNKKINQFITSSALLSLVNIITLIMIIILIVNKNLKFKSSKVFVEMNNENNDNSENIKSRRAFSIKIKKKEDEPSSADRNEDKISGRFNSTAKDEDNEKIEKRESIELMKKHNTTMNPMKSPRNITMNNVSSNNLGVASSIDNTNNSNNIIIISQTVIANKEIKYASIYVLLQISDIILFLYTITFVYIKSSSSMGLVSLWFMLLNFLFSVLNYPITKRLIKNLSQKQKGIIAFYIKRLLYICIIVTLVIGICIPVYFNFFDWLNKTLNYFFIGIMFCFALGRNILISNLIQCYQIYVTVDFHIENESMRRLNTYQHNFTAISKAIFCLIGSMSYLFFTSKPFKNITTTVISSLYFIVFPVGLICIILLLVNLYM